MTAFDVVVLAILGASILISVVRGLVKEILSLVAWVAAFVIATLYASDLAALLPDAIPAGTIRFIAAFAILLIGTLLVGALVNLAIAHIISASGLKVVDRGLGGLFGLGRGLVIVVTLVILAGLTELPRQPVWRDAVLSPLAESAARTVKPWLPDSWARHVRF